MTPARLGRLLLAVLIAHLLLLDALDRALDALDRGTRARPPAPLSIRTVAAPPPAAATMPAAVAVPQEPQVAPQSMAVAMPRAQAAKPASRLPAPSSAAPGAARIAAVTAAMPPPPVRVAPPEASAVDVPTYRTLVPPPFTYLYDLRRGGRSGRAELRWAPQEAQYTARLAGSLDGRPWIAWDSEGAFDAAGLAPRRHVDRRHGRGALAANFQREAGKVTFSGPSLEHPLVPGAQDGLSWMLQLAAIAAADPSLVGPGGRVSLVVVGVRGEADVWTFVHVGEERLDAAAGDVPTLHLLREAQRPHDVRAEVWLDASRHFLPVGARLSTNGGVEALWLRLREVVTSP